MSDHEFRRRTDDDDEENKPRIIDVKFSLMWLLSTAGAIASCFAMTLWAVAGMSNKLDQLIVSNTNLEKRMNDRDARIDAIRDKAFETKSVLDSHQLRIEELERVVRARIK